ncbi:MAG TPA: winged helix DNA-binding domain-containing protein [Candidatus Limnocylindrales bacterium]|nr:winged helix DNA-binding domain-containing protein [Candidatus Limnocylindrales bacterium]
MLTARELNRAVLARQLLLRRADVSVPAALESICGVQDQYAPNGYIRLWSCVQDFAREDLTRALVRRSVVQGTLMRGTIHLVSARDYPIFVAAIREFRREWARGIHKQDDSDRSRAVARIRGRLRGRTVDRRDLGELAGGASPAVLQTIDTDAELLRVPPSGTWEHRRASTLALASEWLGRTPKMSARAALAHLVTRYLRAFGPAPAQDIASFIGASPAHLRPVLASLGLRRFRDEPGRELLDLPGAPLPDADTPAPVRFLPTWDALLLIHARRTGVLDESYRKVIFRTTAPQSFPTFLVDGRVAGTWSYTEGRVRLEPFERLGRAVRRELADEGERLAAFHR